MARLPADQWRPASEVGGGSEPPPERVLPPDTLSISTLARRIRAALRSTFPGRVWVVGEAFELERNAHRKHWFFRLSETSPEDGKQYALSAVLWAADVSRLFGPGGRLEGIIEPRDGIELRVLCDVDFYPPTGDLRLVVRDVDPAYTLGKLALEKQQLVERLTREGVLARQRQLVLSELPLRVGLITSENSAAYNDFVKELLGSGQAFQILFFDARMQGEETVRTVVRGLQVLVSEQVDAIALIRGGGSTTDLAWFDREEIARAIASLKVPVLTGIGHEIDNSVADLAAHTAFKTPTAVAAFLAECGAQAERFVSSARDRLFALVERPEHERVALQSSLKLLLALVSDVNTRGRVELVQLAHAARHKVARRLARESGLALGLHLRLGQLAGAALRLAERRISSQRSRLATTPVLLQLPGALAVLGMREQQVSGSAARRLARLRAELAPAARAQPKLYHNANIYGRFETIGDRRP